MSSLPPDGPWPDEQQVALLFQGSDAWNAWRKQNPDVWVNLNGADLRKAHLYGVNLSCAHLRDADLRQANLSKANLSGANLNADLSGAILSGADLSGADLTRADLSQASLGSANLSKAHLSRADLSQADLSQADLTEANLSQAKLRSAKLFWADLAGTNLSQADLTSADLTGSNLAGALLAGANLASSDLIKVNLVEANLTRASLIGASLIEANLKAADLTDCRVYGISAWNLKLDGAEQKNLIITPPWEPEISVDNLEVAQFIYLLLHNEKIRDVIDTITTKAVLILGRFTPERKTVLDAVREELRKRNRTPIVFDFDSPESKNVTDTVKLLAQLARYIIVDLSDPNSAPYELGVISMLGLDSTPVVPLIANGQRPFPMLDDVLRKPWSTGLVTYQDLDDIRANVDEMLIKIAEAKVQELKGASLPIG